MGGQSGGGGSWEEEWGIEERLGGTGSYRGTQRQAVRVVHFVLSVLEHQAGGGDATPEILY